MAQKILVISENPYILNIYKIFLEEGYEIITADAEISALDSLKNKNPQIILMEREVGNLSRLDLLKKIRESDRRVKIIVIARSKTEQLLDKDIKDFNISKVLTKPFHVEELRGAIIELMKSN